MTRRKNKDLHYILGGGRVGPPPAKKSDVSSNSQQLKPAARAYQAPAASNVGGGAGAAKTIGGAGAGANSAAMKALEAQLQELKLQNDTLDKERDFYFSKLRDIEMLLQARAVEEAAGKELGQDILKILYAAEEEKVDVAADGGLTITGPDGQQVIAEPIEDMQPVAENGDAGDAGDVGNPDAEMN